MTTFTVKLVDHRESTSHETSGIQKSIERVFGLAFDGTSDQVSVSWGSGDAADNLVIHFVEDIAHSYLLTKWPKMKKPDPEAGGHTHSHGSQSGTELYRKRPSGKIHLSQYGVLAFHEALHNLFPFRDDVHTNMGGGIASAHIPNEDPNDENKQWLRRGFSGKNPQLL